MAKKKTTPALNPDHYEYIKAIVDCEGNLRITYRLNGSMVTGRDSHDEDVSDYTDDQIKIVIRSILSVEKDDPVEISILHD